MNSMGKNEIYEKAESISMEELVGKIRAEPSKWVLFLGDGISYNRQNDHKKILSDLAKEASGKKGMDPMKQEKIYETIHNGDYTACASVLFGNVWDGASFRDEAEEKQVKWRKKYAKRLSEREKINISNAPVDLTGILEVFGGIILTTCQDETIEAFLEYEKSRPVDDIVFTPHILTVSEEWNRWIKGGNIRHTSALSEEELRENRHILVKLYGSRKNPYRMLMSKEDFKEYYPGKWKEKPEKEQMLNAMLFLEKIFRTKNVLFLGVDFGKEGSLAYAKGILELLAAAPENVERYVFGEKETELLGKYHLKSVGAGKADMRIEEFVRRLAERMQAWKDEADKSGMCEADGAGMLEAGEHGVMPEEADEEGKALLDGEGEDTFREEISEAAGMKDNASGAESLLTQQAVMEQFWHYYSRRSKNKVYSTSIKSNVNDVITEKETDILKTKILGFEGEDKISKRWNKQSIEQLAIAANNMADFYDLAEVFSMEEALLLKKSRNAKKTDRKSEEFYEIVTRNILNDRISTKSRELHQILSSYGNGFPLGFLTLLSDSGEELKEWKRAGIQLTNSGIYVKRQHRKNLHERMCHADNVMKTAGTNPYKKEIKNVIKEMYHQPEDSYFYPLDSELIHRAFKGKEKEYFEKMFGKMFGKMHDILRDKSEGYKQLHSLLQTEMPEIIMNLAKLEDMEAEDGKGKDEKRKSGESEAGKNGIGKLQWKLALLYYLIRESRAIPKDCGILREQLERLLAKAEASLKDGNKNALLDKALILQTESLIESQSDKDEEQRLALEKCEEARRMLDVEDKKEKDNQKKDNQRKDSQGQDKQEQNNQGGMPEKIFEQIIQIYLLKGKICGRRSTIWEMERCKKEESQCDEQKAMRKMLKEMKENLKKAENLIEGMEKLLDKRYDEAWAELNHLKGEYFFKESQYYWEDRKYGNGKEMGKIEKGYYKDAKICYEKALEYYARYPDRFSIQRADVMRNLADLYCRKGQGIREGKEKDELKEKCYNMLIDAYVLYRGNADLHGIADVLQSMGNAEDFGKIGEMNRSPFCFYKVSKDLYDYLGDEWSSKVVENFYEQKVEELEKLEKERREKEEKM